MVTKFCHGNGFESQFLNLGKLQGVSYILFILRCKILSQNFSEKLKSLLFLIVNLKTFYEGKTKFKNFQYFVRYSSLSKSSQFDEFHEISKN